MKGEVGDLVVGESCPQVHLEHEPQFGRAGAGLGVGFGDGVDEGRVRIGDPLARGDPGVQVVAGLSRPSGSCG